MKNKFKLIREDQTRTSSLTFFNNELATHNPTQSPHHMHMQGGRTTEAIMKKTEWTNEKHSMYLKSIEASFVNQLYDSKHMMISSLPHKGTIHDPSTTSGQFKVLRGGNWKKINFERDNQQQQMMSRTNNNNQSHNNLTSNPWIQHYRSPIKQRISNEAAVPSLQESITSTSRVYYSNERNEVSLLQKQLHGSHVSQKDMLSSDTEMSDQNFVDEEVEVKKQSKRNKGKRLRSLIIDAKGKDQMVPTKSSSIEDVTKNCFPAD